MVVTVIVVIVIAVIIVIVIAVIVVVLVSQTTKIPSSTRLLNTLTKPLNTHSETVVVGSSR